MTNYMTYIGTVVMGLYLIGCGGGGPTVSMLDGCTSDACGSVQLTVKGAQSFNPSIDHGRIVEYRVSISGPGIEGELVTGFPGDAEEGVIEGIPAGDDRRIEVRAINPNRAVIREGEEDGVVIGGGSTADVNIMLESVPLFTNLMDGSVVENTRLVFRIFADPDGSVVIEDLSSSKSELLANASSASPEVAFDEVTGLGVMSPAVLLPGEHAFTARNTLTDRSSTVAVRLIDGSKRKAAPLFSASTVAGDDVLSIMNAGEPWSR